MEVFLIKRILYEIFFVFDKIMIFGFSCILIYELISAFRYSSVIFNADRYPDNRLSLGWGIIVILCLAVAYIYMSLKNFVYSDNIIIGIIVIILLIIFWDYIPFYFLWHNESYIIFTAIYIYFSIFALFETLISVIVKLVSKEILI